MLIIFIFLLVKKRSNRNSVRYFYQFYFNYVTRIILLKQIYSYGSYNHDEFVNLHILKLLYKIKLILYLV